jgi:hypothetical protein
MDRVKHPYIYLFPGVTIQVLTAGTVAYSRIVVFGGTGPGICLLRELLFRNHAVVAFARNPGKIPEDLLSDPLLEASLQELLLSMYCITLRVNVLFATLGNQGRVD